MSSQEILKNLDKYKFFDEVKLVNSLLDNSPISNQIHEAGFLAAKDIVIEARKLPKPAGALESFLEEYGLTTKEGLALMCLAEGLLRIPDTATADNLIAEKITSGNWSDHIESSENLLMHASALGLMLSGKIIDIGSEAKQDFGAFIHKITRKLGEPIIRAATYGAMRIMGEQFVLGRNIDAAIERGRNMIKEGVATNFSFDMLGEGAREDDAAQRYFQSYKNAINALGAIDGQDLGPTNASGISVKLSALHARYDARQPQKIFTELYPRVLELAQLAAHYDIGFCIDAEEADRLVISLEILSKLAAEPSLKHWNGLGLAVQAFQKRALNVIDFLIALGRENNRRFMVRLVKGAYWDTEIKRAQIGGRPDFPVFTTKPATDVSYILAADKLLNNPSEIFPQFATHNAHSLAIIMEMAAQKNITDFEFQRLHGMGETLYKVALKKYDKIKIRVYAPVGAHEDLLPYLVRRLLENGANTSFVHAFLNKKIPPEDVIANPFEIVKYSAQRHEKVPTPANLFGTQRKNSQGYDLTMNTTKSEFENAILNFKKSPHDAHSIIDGKEFISTNNNKIISPSQNDFIIGNSTDCDDKNLLKAFEISQNYQPDWNELGGNERANIIDNIAKALEDNAHELIACLCLEAGKTLEDGIAELREAVDFCHYYANGARHDFENMVPLPSPAGETNHLGLMGRGVFVCISPWNFPLAIFTGQIIAALAAGNCVLAKPAEQTPLIASLAVKLFYQAGLPTAALHLVLGGGDIGSKLCALDNIAGIAFTGSTEVAKLINLSLAKSEGAIKTLIAETGGLNAMFVDTSALIEQVVDDVIISAFGSAGQRCSALRVLYLPHETADDIIASLKGAMDQLVLGNPEFVKTDIGPVIDKDALQILENHIANNRAKIIKQMELGDLSKVGTYFAPTIMELGSIDELSREVFGPILHIIRYSPKNVEIEGKKLAAKKYGLTLGAHSRIDAFVEAVRKSVPAGNYYVNRTMIGAVVGAQPFGGLGLSGTGPKAGGPHYLHRFATEQVISNNISAKGGDPNLFNL